MRIPRSELVFAFRILVLATLIAAILELRSDFFGRLPELVFQKRLPAGKVYFFALMLLSMRLDPVSLWKAFLPLVGILGVALIVYLVVGYSSDPALLYAAFKSQFGMFVLGVTPVCAIISSMKFMYIYLRK